MITTAESMRQITAAMSASMRSKLVASIGIDQERLANVWPARCWAQSQRCCCDCRNLNQTMAFLTRRTTTSTPALLLIPLRSLALALGLTHCGYAVSEGATVGGATDLAFGLFLGFAAVAPLRLAIPAFAYLFVTTSFLRIRALADETGLPSSLRLSSRSR